MDNYKDREISFPEGVATFDPEDKSPVRIGLNKLFHSSVDPTEVRAIYEPGNALVIFENGTGNFDVNDKETLAEKLDKVGVLMAQLFNVTQQIQMLKDVLKITNDFRESLSGIKGLPTNSTFPNGNLGEYVSSAVSSLLEFRGEMAGGNNAFLKALEQERDAVFEEMKALGVKGINSQGIQVMSSYNNRLSVYS